MASAPAPRGETEHSPGWKIADESTSLAVVRTKRTIGLVGRVSGRVTRRLADECTLTPQQDAAGRPGAVPVGPARERVPTLRAARPRAEALSLLDLHTWQFSFVKRRGTPLPSGNMVPRLGCFGPGGSKRLDGKPRPHRGAVRHERKARGLSIGALLGARHDAACATHVGAGEASTSAASATLAPARWREPLTGRMERPDQAGPGARGRVTTATPARLDFSAAEAAVKALQARCPQVATSVLTVRPCRDKGYGPRVDDRHARSRAFLAALTWRQRPGFETGRVAQGEDRLGTCLAVWHRPRTADHGRRLRGSLARREHSWKLSSRRDKLSRWLQEATPTPPLPLANKLVRQPSATA